MLDGITGAAAFVHNARLDNLATNELARALYSEMFTRGAGSGPVNSARYAFLDPGARDFYIDWDRAAGDIVAILRSAAGRDPYDRELSASSASCPRRAPSFAPAGRRTTSASTTPAPRSSITLSSVSSRSPTTASSSPPTPISRSRSTPRSPEPNRPRR
jgi:hypothetical protein